MKPFPWEAPSATIEGLPVFRGIEARRDLVRRFGLPNAAPRPGESLFGRCRELFVDDENDGRPVAYWLPDREEAVTKYTISRLREEAQCEECGWPIAVGDAAIETDTGRIACSVDHARAIDARRRKS